MNGERDDGPAGQFDPQQHDTTREAMDRLNDRNRVLTEARMLPSHAALTDEQVAEIRDHFKAYIAEHDIKAAQVAREVRYSQAVVSTWAAGTYKGNVSTVTHAVNNWMERDARRRLSRRPTDYVKTWIAEDIRTYCYAADKHGKMAVIVAPSGTGKTKVLRALVEEMRGVYVCCTDRMRLGAFYLALATELGWERENGTKYALQRFIIERLTGTNRIVFVDEAHQLGRDISSLRTIYDQAQTPIVMVGTDEVETLSNDRHHGRGQFSSRCIRYNALDHAYNAESPGGGGGAAEGKDLFTVDEVRAFFAKKKIRLDADALRLMWAIACLPGHGSLRLVEDVVHFAYEFAGDAETLTRDMILSGLDCVLSGGAGYVRRLASRQMERWPEAPAAARAAGVSRGMARDARRGA